MLTPTEREFTARSRPHLSSATTRRATIGAEARVRLSAWPGIFAAPISAPARRCTSASSTATSFGLRMGRFQSFDYTRAFAAVDRVFAQVDHAEHREIVFGQVPPAEATKLLTPTARQLPTGVRWLKSERRSRRLSISRLRPAAEALYSSPTIRSNR